MSTVTNELIEDAKHVLSLLAGLNEGPAVKLARFVLKLHEDNTETINWISVKESLPDEGIIVLTLTDSTGEPVWPSYLDEGEWRSAEGGLLSYQVRKWAEMPKGPE